MTAPQLVQRTMSYREKAIEKVREADEFLRGIETVDHGHPTDFRRVFNACVGAARSGFWFLRAEDEVAFDAWEASLPATDQEILVAIRTARDIAMHAGGAEMSPKAFSYIPTPGNYRHTLELIAADGSNVVLPAAGALRRYLGILRAKLGVVA